MARTYCFNIMGTEILRTEGIGVAEFLYFLGCRPTWNEEMKL